jgi:hypothetical protein
MERSFKILAAFSIVLILGVTFAGCSDTSGSSPDGSATPTIVPAETAQYTAGDIVWKTSSTSIAWLIISYDPAADSYTRATIHQNPDGTWGYRTDAKTETANRAAVEKVNTVLIRHVSIGSIPTTAPTTIPTATATTRVTTAATTTTTTTTTAAVLLPTITKIDPEEGTAGESVTIDITGTNFDKNATARLQHSGEDSISASGVTWISSTKLTATFAIPNSTLVGAWDVVVTNSGSKSGSLKNYFLVHGNTDE